MCIPPLSTTPLFKHTIDSGQVTMCIPPLSATPLFKHTIDSGQATINFSYLMCAMLQILNLVPPSTTKFGNGALLSKRGGPC